MFICGHGAGYIEKTPAAVCYCCMFYMAQSLDDRLTMEELSNKLCLSMVCSKVTEVVTHLEGMMLQLWVAELASKRKLKIYINGWRGKFGTKSSETL